MANQLESFDPLVMSDGLVTSKNVTLNSASVFDASGSTGAFKTSTGTNTLGGNVAISGAGTLTAGTGAIRLDTGAVTQKANLISGSGATVTLTTAQSGSSVLFDRAAGIVYTLPAPAVGMFYDFVVTTTITSNAATVVTDAGTTFVQGMLYNSVAAGTGTMFYGNGTTHIKVTSNGTTSGGVLGSWYRFLCVSSTIWNVFGFVAGSGTIINPFST